MALVDLPLVIYVFCERLYVVLKLNFHEVCDPAPEEGDRARGSL